jgi:ABC-type glycerol-3-phosphate transport system substrate-binding protein
MARGFIRRSLPALAAVLLLIGGCGARNAAPDGRTHVALWSGWTGNEGKAFQRIVDRFNAAHPALFVENLGGVQDDTKTLRALTAGAPPDLFFLWNPAYLGPLVENGAVRSLDDAFRKSGMKRSEFLPAALAMGTANGRLYSLPYLVDCQGLFWNKAAFREAGLDPEKPPQTLDELAEAARRLTKRDARGNIVRLGLDLPEFALIMFDCGGRYLDERGRPMADDPRNVAALRWYRDLIGKMGGIGQVNSFASGYGQGQGPNHPFFQGKTAMMISGEYIPGWVERYAPTLSYGLAPVPFARSYPAGKGTTLVGGNPILIPTESKHPEAAWEFIRWVQTPAAQEAFAGAMNNVPNVRAALTSPGLTRGSLRKRNFGKFLRYADHPNARVTPISPVMSYYQSEMNNARDFVLHGDKTPEAALADVQRKVMAEWERVAGK